MKQLYTASLPEMEERANNERLNALLEPFEAIIGKAGIRNG